MNLEKFTKPLKFLKKPAVALVPISIFGAIYLLSWADQRGYDRREREVKAAAARPVDIDAAAISNLEKLASELPLPTAPAAVEAPKSATIAADSVAKDTTKKTEAVKSEPKAISAALRAKLNAIK